MNYVVVPAPNAGLSALLAVPGLLVILFGAKQLIALRPVASASVEPLSSKSRNWRIYQWLLGCTSMSVGLVHLAVVALTRSLGPLEGARALGIVYFLMALLVLAVTFHHSKNGFVSTRMGRVYVGLIAASFTYGGIWYYLH